MEKVKKMKKSPGLAWLLCALWMGVIFAMSAMPGDVSGDQSGKLTAMILFVLRMLPGSLEKAIAPQTLEFLLRKGAHMAEYAVLFLFYRRALRLSGAKHPGLYALMLSASYAATDEFHQSFVDGRGPGAMDVMIDTVGAAIAWAGLGLYERIKSLK